tara:strand:+ start:556 stop:687 length:132 start_codon:yes stop_codon:yes gene_type:complete
LLLSNKYFPIPQLVQEVGDDALLYVPAPQIAQTDAEDAATVVL